MTYEISYLDQFKWKLRATNRPIEINQSRLQKVIQVESEKNKHIPKVFGSKIRLPTMFSRVVPNNWSRTKWSLFVAVERTDLVNISCHLVFTCTFFMANIFIFEKSNLLSTQRSSVVKMSFFEFFVKPEERIGKKIKEHKFTQLIIIFY